MGFLFLLESRTNSGAKFNFIGIKKKIEGAPKFFLKGIQINFFIIIYNFFFFRPGWSWDHPAFNVVPPLRIKIYCTY